MVEICDGGGGPVKNTVCFSGHFPYIFRTFYVHNQYDFRIKKHTKHKNTLCFLTRNCTGYVWKMSGKYTENVRKIYRNCPKKHTVFLCFVCFLSGNCTG